MHAQIAVNQYEQILYVFHSKIEIARNLNLIYHVGLTRQTETLFYP